MNTDFSVVHFLSFLLALFPSVFLHLCAWKGWIMIAAGAPSMYSALILALQMAMGSVHHNEI